MRWKQNWLKVPVNTKFRIIFSFSWSSISSIVPHRQQSHHTADTLHVMGWEMVQASFSRAWTEKSFQTNTAQACVSSWGYVENWGKLIWDSGLFPVFFGSGSNFGLKPSPGVKCRVLVLVQCALYTSFPNTKERLINLYFMAFKAIPQPS